MAVDDSGRIEELARELDALRATKNSEGYALLVKRLQESNEKAIAELIHIDPDRTGDIGILQGNILTTRIFIGDKSYRERQSLVEVMIDEAQEELDKLTREDTPRTGRPDSMRMSSLRR